MDARSATAATRLVLAEVFDGFSEQQWSEPSLCEGWTAKHVLAHQTMLFRLSTPAFLFAMARARGRFHVAADRVARRDAAAVPTAVLLRSMREAASTEKTFPKGGFEGALTHDVVHGLDICRPLGIAPPIAGDALRIVLTTLADPVQNGYFGVDLAGTQLQATDLDWSYGEGAPAPASAHDLILLLAGRDSAGQLGPGSTARTVQGSE